MEDCPTCGGPICPDCGECVECGDCECGDVDDFDRDELGDDPEED